MKILGVCGSPRKGNSEAILNRLKEIFRKKGVESEIVLLREKNIQRCGGCVEYCNKNLNCFKKDDMAEILDKIRNSDGYVFVSPNYFKMPPGIFKNFIDRCSVLYTAKTNLSVKRAVVIVVGTDEIKEIDVCLNVRIPLFFEWWFTLWNSEHAQKPHIDKWHDESCHQSIIGGF